MVVAQFEIRLASTGSASGLGVNNQLPELVEGSDSEITKVKLVRYHKMNDAVNI